MKNDAFLKWEPHFPLILAPHPFYLHSPFPPLSLQTHFLHIYFLPHSLFPPHSSISCIPFFYSLLIPYSSAPPHSTSFASNLKCRMKRCGDTSPSYSTFELQLLHHSTPHYFDPISNAKCGGVERCGVISPSSLPLHYIKYYIYITLYFLVLRLILTLKHEARSPPFTLHASQ
jgi:hypothetical protein